MPSYNFKCNYCNNISAKTMSMSDFLKSKSDQIICLECKNGFLTHHISKVNSSIEKNSDINMMDIKDQVKRVVEKVKSGDLRTIEDVYGSQPNKFKK
jgi:hypothetical protein